MKPRRSKRWDTIGTVWKWIAGSPDAQDLDIINSTLNQLIDQNNHQMQINSFFNSRIAEVTTTINRLLEQQSTENKILLEEMDALTLLLYMDTTNEILEQLEDTILKTRIDMPNSKLLSLQEILTLETLLNEQGILTNFPEDAFNYVKPKIATKNDLILYILQIPKIEGSCEIFHIIPLTIANNVITKIPKYIVRYNDLIYQTENPNQVIQEDTMLTLLKDKCSYPIILGMEANCEVEFDDTTKISLINNNKILINNAKGTQMGSNCGPHNRTLFGNLIITFHNCSIRINEQTFSSEERISNIEELPAPFYNLTIKRNFIKQQSISSIHNQTMTNRIQLNHIKLEHFNYRKITFAIFGGISSTVVIMIGLTIVCLYRKRVVVKIGNHTKSEDGLHSSTGGVMHRTCPCSADRTKSKVRSTCGH